MVSNKNMDDSDNQIAHLILSNDSHMWQPWSLLNNVQGCYMIEEFSFSEKLYCL